MDAVSTVLNENFIKLKEEAAGQNISCEIVSGHIIQRMYAGEEGRKLCFILGTMLEDYFSVRKRNDSVRFGPVDVMLDGSNVFTADLITVNEKEADTLPGLVIQIMSPENIICDCLDKACAYSRSGVSEYWVIDLNGQNVYTYCFLHGFDYRRFTFEQTLRSLLYPGFECCISDIMWEDEGTLKDLAVFFRFRKEVMPEPSGRLLADTDESFKPAGDRQYTAEEFYEWISARKNAASYSTMVELMMGNVRESLMPRFRHQNICGNLYFTIKSFLKNGSGMYRLYFAPVVVEMRGPDLLDSVVVPDLFLVSSSAVIHDNVCLTIPKWIIEIVSPQTAASDYIDKAQLYQYHKVSEYWIINDWKRQVMVLNYDADNENGAETCLYGFADRVPVRSLPGLKIVMDEVLKIM